MNPAGKAGDIPGATRTDSTC